VFSNIGFGTRENPFVIVNVAQLQSAANTNSYYILQDDIALPLGFTMQNFSARLNGNGHTIQTQGTAPIIYNLSGEVTNLNIAVINTYLGTQSNFALLAINNTGIIEDVSLSLVENTSMQVVNATGNYAMVAGLVHTNRGRVANVYVTGSLTVTSQTYIPVRVAGIVGFNTATGTGLSPQTPSIVNADNNLNITLIANNNNNESNIIMGGIAVRNDGVMTRAKNRGNITLTTNNGVSDVGGIVGYAPLGTVRESGHRGIITTNLIGSAITFVGGIAGYTYRGSFIDNFSFGTVVYSGRRQDSAFFRGSNMHFGGIFGTIRGGVEVTAEGNRFSTILYGTTNRNYYVRYEGTINFGAATFFGITVGFFGGQTIAYPNDIPDHRFNTIAKTRSELEQHSVSWEVRP